MASSIIIQKFFILFWLFNNDFSWLQLSFICSMDFFVLFKSFLTMIKSSYRSVLHSSGSLSCILVICLSMTLISFKAICVCVLVVLEQAHNKNRNKHQTYFIYQYKINMPLHFFFLPILFEPCH